MFFGFVLFCFVLFVCLYVISETVVCLTKTVLLLLCFGWTFLFPATFYTLNQRIDTQRFMFYRCILAPIWLCVPCGVSVKSLHATHRFDGFRKRR